MFILLQYEELQSWDSWGQEASETPNSQMASYPTAAQNGHLGYRHPAMPNEPATGQEDEEPDFFSGMQPEIRRTKKVGLHFSFWYHFHWAIDRAGESIITRNNRMPV